MAKPIAIVELYKHSEVLTHYCDLFLFGNHQLYVFCNEELYNDLPQRLKDHYIKWFLNDSEKNIDKFIKKNEASIKECQFLLITTVFSHFNIYIKLASWVRSALIIHSAHVWLEPHKHIHIRKEKKIIDCLRLLKSILMRKAYLRKKLLKEVEYIGLPNESILNYVKTNLNPPEISKFASIPFGAYLGMPEKRIDPDCTTFTITGSIGDDVRDYPSVIEVIKLLLPSLKRRIKIVLLGKVRDKKNLKIIKAFKQIHHPLLEIITFSGYIPEIDFNTYLVETDYLILPLKKYTQFNFYQELTCYSKLSGSVNDMIRYGIPAITSRNCTVDGVVDQSLIYYENSIELANTILELSTIKKEFRSNEEAKNIFSKYLIENLYNDLLEIIQLKT